MSLTPSIFDQEINSPPRLGQVRDLKERSTGSAVSFIKGQALYKAVVSRDVQLVALHLMHYSNAAARQQSAACSPLEWYNREKHNRTSLHESCEAGSYDITLCLLAHGANPNVTDRGKWTPLHWAAYRGYSPIISLLIAAGADTTATDRAGTTPLIASGYLRKEDVYKTARGGEAVTRAADAIRKLRRCRSDMEGVVREARRRGRVRSTSRENNTDQYQCEDVVQHSPELVVILLSITRQRQQVLERRGRKSDAPRVVYLPSRGQQAVERGDKPYDFHVYPVMANLDPRISSNEVILKKMLSFLSFGTKKLETNQ